MEPLQGTCPLPVEDPEKKEVNLDDLLLWLSAKSNGSWPLFRSAVEMLKVEPPDVWGDSEEDRENKTAGRDLPLYQELRYAMERLGHVEFFAKGIESGWRVVPPTVAICSDTLGRAFLCGARSPELLEDLKSLDDIDVSFSGSHGGPSRVCLRGSSPQVVAAHARTLGLHAQYAAPIAILSSLPRARDPRTWQRLPMPKTSGWTVHRFSSSRFRWSEVSRAYAAKAAKGLFKFQLGFQRIYFLCWRGDTYRVPVQVGKYALVRRRARLLKYDSQDRVLAVPTMYRPPLLIERALILCSGLLPRIDSKTRLLEYVDVPPRVVRIAAQLLEQER